MEQERSRLIPEPSVHLGIAYGQPYVAALHVVDGGSGGVAAAGGCGPVHDAGLGLGEPPAGGLLASVVATAGGGQVALAGDAGGVGEGVVEVAVDGLGAAAGRGAPGGPGADEPEKVNVDVPRPPNWGGYRLYADAVELWVEGEFRIHDRARWTRSLPDPLSSAAATPWIATRLQP